MASRQRSGSIYILTLFAFFLFFGCGGSSGSDAPLLTAESSSTIMRGGEVMTLNLFTNGFELTEPVGVAPKPGEQYVGALQRNIAVDLGDVMHAEEAVDEEPIESDIHVHDDGTEHDHNVTSATSPFATEGHVHIYLDGGSGTDAHVTAWAHVLPIVLPEHLTPGTHSLRIELRDNAHVPVGGEHDQFVFFEVVE